MSFFILPHTDTIATQMRAAGLDEGQAAKLLTALRQRLAEKSAMGLIQLNHMEPDSLDFDRFDMPVIEPVDGLGEVEEKIARSLAVSRVPKASGNRGVFVDLTAGVILVGRCVMFNANRACEGVVDASLEHKMDLIEAVTSLISFSRRPWHGANRVSLSVDGGPAIPLAHLLSLYQPR